MLFGVVEHQSHLTGWTKQGDEWDGIFGYLTSHEAYCLCVGNHSGHNLHTRG